MEKVLVVAAHPDDELLGLGGTLLKHRDAGDEVSVFLYADGESSRDGVKEGSVEERHKSSLNVFNQLGVSSYKICGMKDNQLDSFSLLELVKPLEAFATEVQPTIVYTHFANDLNVDHQLVSQAVLTAFRPLPGSKVKSILEFETLSSTEWTHPLKGFQPNYFVDISEYLEKKKILLEEYDGEMRSFPHSRSYENIDHLAKYRGASVGCNAAEAFRVLRFIHR